MTSFDYIYQIFLDTEVSSQNLLNLDDYDLSNQLQSILLQARAELYYYLYSNKGTSLNIVEDITEYTTYFDNFVFSTSYSFTSTNNFDDTYSIVIYVNDILLDEANYTVNFVTKTFTITSALSVGDRIQIIEYKNPIFNQTLDLSQIGLIVIWMGVVFLRNKLKDQKVYNFTIFGVEDKFASQANQMKELKESLKEAEKLAKDKTMQYTYIANPLMATNLIVKGG